MVQIKKEESIINIIIEIMNFLFEVIIKFD